MVLRTSVMTLNWATSQEDHDKNLNEVLKRIQGSRIKINLEKCIFSGNQLIFSGRTLSDKGVTPDASKVEAIQKIDAQQLYHE